MGPFEINSVSENTIKYLQYSNDEKFYINSTSITDLFVVIPIDVMTFFFSVIGSTVSKILFVFHPSPFIIGIRRGGGPLEYFGPKGIHCCNLSTRSSLGYIALGYYFSPPLNRKEPFGAARFWIAEGSRSYFSPNGAF